MTHKIRTHKYAATLLLLSLITTKLVTPAPPSVALRGCDNRCGTTPIPYPFGITRKCSHNSWFEITCDRTTHPATPSLTNLKWNFTDYLYQAEIHSISVGSLKTVTIIGSNDAVSRDSAAQMTPWLNLDMRGSPYVLMGMRNSLVVFDCGGSVVIRNSLDQIVAGCSTVCSSSNATSLYQSSGCFGIRCCQTTVTSSLDYFQMEYLTNVFKGRSSNLEWINATVVNSSYLTNESFVESSLQSGLAPTILQWRIADLPINSSQYSNSICTWDVGQQDYSCRCKHDYFRGNPYLPNGCQVMKECEKCSDSCTATIVGSSRAFRCPHKANTSPIPIALGIGISLGTLLICITVYALYLLAKEKKELRQKHNNFKRNGGLLLRQQMIANKGVIERIRVFTCTELTRATDNFNKSRILGCGGQGIVYKGMLVDGTIVAIKMSTKVDENQLSQFINEVVILSQVNHKNVVKLFGCCLETDVPLLVYEFVPNGTISQHLHNPSEDFRITWKMRLQIAVESSEALAYLHSSSFAPIYHCDIKTSNILLDDKYRPKVSDFGICKSISADQTHLTTRVQGTFGYIDPEFFRSNRFTDKSDVYSFGIVLVELLTSNKPVITDKSTDARSLASMFLLALENSQVYDIVDVKVLEESRKEELDSVVDLARQCLHLNGKQRPGMKEVAAKLQMILSPNRAHDESPKQIDNEKKKNEQNFVMDGSLLSYISTLTLSDNLTYLHDQPSTSEMM